MSEVTLRDGSKLTTHDPHQCIFDHCCIHNPSDHPLRDAPMEWLDFGDAGVVYRACSHGSIHPDPDAVEFLANLLKLGLVEAISSTHMSNCDGCCRTPSK